MIQVLHKKLRAVNGYILVLRGETLTSNGVARLVVHSKLDQPWMNLRLESKLILFLFQEPS